MYNYLNGEYGKPPATIDNTMDKNFAKSLKWQWDEVLIPFWQKQAKKNLNGVLWQVLEWNEPAINFYNKYSPTFNQEWITCTIEKV